MTKPSPNKIVLSAQEELNQILKEQRFVRLIRPYRGIDPPYLQDADTGQILFNSRSKDIILHKVQESGWHVVGSLRWCPEPLESKLIVDGWQSLETVPERVPIQTYLKNYHGEGRANFALVLIHKTWFMAQPFEALDYPSIVPLAWKPWTNPTLDDA